MSQKQIDIECPICGKKGNIKIPESVLSQKKVGTIKVKIPAGAICPEHDFLIFISKDGKIRGYEKIDILTGTAIEDSQNQPIKKYSLKELIQMCSLTGIINLLHAKIFNYPIFIHKNPHETEIKSVNHFFNNFIPKKYRDVDKLKFFDEEDISKVIENEKDSLILDLNFNVLNVPWKEKLKFEEGLIKNASEIFAISEQIILIQQYINQLIKEVECAQLIIEEEGDLVNKDIIIDTISRKCNVPKIGTYRLSLIALFIDQRINPELSLKIKFKGKYGFKKK